MPTPLGGQPDTRSTPSGPRRPGRYQRPNSYRHAAAGSAALVLITAGLSLPAVSLPGLISAAQASPVEPGIGGASDYPLCAAPQAAPGPAGWSRVTCGVGAHQFIVPAGIRVLRVVVTGAAGGHGGGGAPGGAGEQIRASIVVSPGQRLELAVGSAGDSHEHGGFNGGGDGPHPGATGRTASGGGGGSSDLRPGPYGEPSTRVITAAGGGGGGGAPTTGGRAGGNGGRPGGAGRTAPGTLGGPGGRAATTAAGNGAPGGTGGTAGTAGSFAGLIGGRGGRGQQSTTAASAGDGGGGGGGFGFGGGGAGGTTPTGAAGAGATAGGGGGGGGGSSSVIPWILQPGIPVAHSARNRGNGSITVTYHAPPISCGSLVYASTTLTTDLDCRGTTGLTVGGDEIDQSDSTGIVLNLGGHTILGDAGGVGIDLDQAGVTVRNGTLRGFGTGISVHDLVSYAGPGAPDATSVLSHLHLTHGGVGIGLDGGAIEAYTLTSVDHTVIDTMSGGAIASDRGDDPMAGSLDVTDSTLRDSAFGAHTTMRETAFEHDTVTGNTGPAFTVATGDGGAALVDNTVLGNGSGISVTTPGGTLYPSYLPDPSTVTITGNTVTGNGGSGIQLTGSLDPAHPGVLSGNVVSNNGRSTPAGDTGDGILVALTADAAGLTVSGNTALFNQGWGIDAIGVTDGGGDLATGNAAGEDCRGVACAAAG